MIDILQVAGDYQPVAAVDCDVSVRSVLGVPVVGDDSALPRLFSEGLKHAFVALGDNALRLRRGRELEEIGYTIVNAISPAATIASTVRLGRGVAIMAGVVINADTEINDYAIINTRASLDHDCRIEESVHIAPGVSLAGNVTVRRLAFLGVGTSVIPAITIGEQAVIGAGACVVRDIPAGCKAVGVPARLI